MNEPKIEIDWSQPLTWSESSPPYIIFPETWQCTPQLRWKQGNRLDPVLQQLWVELETGKQDWRDVPVEI